MDEVLSDEIAKKFFFFFFLIQEWVKLEKKKDWKMESAFKLEMEGPYLQSNHSFPPPQPQAFLLVEAKFCLGVYHLLDSGDMNSKKFFREEK